MSKPAGGAWTAAVHALGTPTRHQGGIGATVQVRSGERLVRRESCQAESEALAELPESCQNSSFWAPQSQTG